MRVFLLFTLLGLVIAQDGALPDLENLTDEELEALYGDLDPENYPDLGDYPTDAPDAVTPPPDGATPPPPDAAPTTPFDFGAFTTPDYGNLYGTTAAPDGTTPDFPDYPDYPTTAAPDIITTPEPFEYPDYTDAPPPIPTPDYPDPTPIIEPTYPDYATTPAAKPEPTDPEKPATDANNDLISALLKALDCAEKLAAADPFADIDSLREDCLANIDKANYFLIGSSYSKVENSIPALRDLVNKLNTDADKVPIPGTTTPATVDSSSPCCQQAKAGLCNVDAVVRSLCQAECGCDLETMSCTGTVHASCSATGNVPKPPTPPCEDRHHYCQGWSQDKRYGDQCDMKKGGWMTHNCRKACGKCCTHTCLDCSLS